MSMFVTHVLDEEASPPWKLVWRMLCGESCFAFEDGRLDPPLEFYMPVGAERATCPRCRDLAGKTGAARSSVASVPATPGIRIPRSPVG